MRRPVLAAAGTAAVLVLAVSGCAVGGTTGAPSAASTAPASTRSAVGIESSAPDASAPDSAAPDASAIEVTGDALSHVHNLAFDGPALLLGSHEGLYRQEPGQQPRLLSQTPFDVMGLTYDGSRWLASGHPGAGEDLPRDLGLRASDDGKTWTTLSLLGEVDFHRLTAAGSTVVGVSAHDGALLRSTDAGSTFTRVDNPGVFDVALDPGNPTTALATTKAGPMTSRDAGSSWALVPGAPLLAFLAWSSSGAYGIAPDGAVYVSTDGGTTWVPRGSTGGQPTAATANGDRVAVLVGATVLESTNGGLTFSARLTGIGRH